MKKKRNDKKKREKNPRTIPMMTMSRDILFVHTLFFLCSLYTKPNHFIKTKTFCQNKWKIWVSQIKRVSMQTDRITRDDKKNYTCIIKQTKRTSTISSRILIKIISAWFKIRKSFSVAFGILILLKPIFIRLLWM